MAFNHVSEFFFKESVIKVLLDVILTGLEGQFFLKHFISLIYSEVQYEKLKLSI